MQFALRLPWIPGLGVEYSVGIDGLGMAMVLLTALLVPMSLLVTPRNASGLHFALTLFLQAGLFGTFTALNFFHWFLFWELSLIPAFFLIKLWGGPDRSAAATQFFVYTMVGSVALLLSFLAILLATGTLDFIQLADLSRKGELAADLSARLGWTRLSAERVSMAIFLGALLGFAVKVPLFPFHTWLPDAHTQAPTGGSVILAGVLLKLGTYGLLRFGVYLFPEAAVWARPLFLTLATIGIIWGAIAATMQKDLKRLVAYSSVAHLGFIVLGTFALSTEAITGGVMQNINHGISTGALFILVGMIYERRHKIGRAHV